MKKIFTELYTAPQIEETQVIVEYGFALSTPEEGREFEDGGDLI